jgi:MoaA/NifB/PqqE/SkfB family radical SAM enzyme
MEKPLFDLKNLAIMITDKCNLDCYHCFREDYKNDKEFDNELTKELVNFVKTTSIDYLRITGGEPFLYKNLLSVVEAFSNINITTSIVSNGTLSTDSKLYKLRKVGLSEIWFSVHSLNESTHDYLTGKTNTLKKLESSIKSSVKYNIKTNIYLPVSYKNMAEVVETLKWLDNLKVNRIKIIKMTPLGKAIPYKFIHVTDTDWLNFIESIKNLNISVASLKIQGVHSSDKIPRCTILPLRHLNIDTDGRIYPCCLISGNQQFAIGLISDIHKKGYLNNLALKAKEIMIKHGSFPCLKSTREKGCPLFSEEINLLSKEKLAVTKYKCNAG